MAVTIAAVDCTIATAGAILMFRPLVKTLQNTMVGYLELDKAQVLQRLSLLVSLTVLLKSESKLGKDLSDSLIRLYTRTHVFLTTL